MLNVKEQEKIYHADTNQKKTGVVTLRSDRRDFGTMTIRSDVKRDTTHDKVSIHQEDLKILLYAAITGKKKQTHKN